MNYQAIIKKAAAIAIIAAFAAAPASALDLSQEKSSGSVGETSSGYLAAVNSSSEVDALVSDINAQRKAHYQAIADKNDVSLSAVEVRAGKKAIEKSPAGAFIDVGNGWQKK